MAVRLQLPLFWYRPHCFYCANQVVLMLTSWHLHEKKLRRLYRSKVTSSLTCIHGRIMNYFYSHSCLANFRRVKEKLASTLNPNLQFHFHILLTVFFGQTIGVFSQAFWRKTHWKLLMVYLFSELILSDTEFWLYLLLKHSSSEFSTDDFLSRHSTRLKQDLQIRQDCLLTSIVWRINREIFSARPTWLSKL